MAMTAWAHYRDHKVASQRFERIETAQSWLDNEHPNCDALIRMDYTSDGSYWGEGGGACVSYRELGMWVRTGCGPTMRKQS